MFYSKTTNGFYNQEIHGNAIPADAVEIIAEDHALLLAAQSAGKIIQADKDGKPVAVDPPKPTSSDIWERIKAERDRRTDQGGYKVGAHWFHSDAKSRSQQQDNEAVGADLAPVQWKTMSGDFVTMTPGLTAQIRTARMASDRAIFDAAEVHRAAMEASSDPAAYDYSTGWPQTYDEATAQAAD